MNKELQILNPDKTVIFLSPFADEDTDLTRTGVIKEDSFFHSILLSYSKEYLEIDDKNDYINKLKDSLFSKKNLINNNYENFKNNLIDIVETTYNYISNNKNDISPLSQKIVNKISKNKIYDLFVELLPLNSLKTILDKDNDENIISFKTDINENIKNHLKSIDILKQVDDKKYKFIKDNILVIINIIIDEVENNIYKYCLDNISTIDSSIVNLVSNRLKINIYIFNSKNRLPILYKNFNYKKSIIILQNKNHYESLGLLINNKVKRKK